MEFVSTRKRILILGLALGILFSLAIIGKLTSVPATVIRMDHLAWCRGNFFVEMEDHYMPEVGDSSGGRASDFGYLMKLGPDSNYREGEVVSNEFDVTSNIACSKDNKYLLFGARPSKSSEFYQVATVPDGVAKFSQPGIYSIDLETGVIVQITTTESKVLNVNFLSEGHIGVGTESGIFVWDSTQNAKREVFSDTTSIYGGPVFAMDGSSYAYIKYDPDPVSWTLRMGQFGHDQEIFAPQIYCEAPVWSPTNSDLVAYYSQGNIFVFDVTNGSYVNLTHDRFSIVGRPSWTPDGEEVSFAGSRKSAVDVNGNLVDEPISIYTATIDGRLHRKVFEGGSAKRHIWSPDGSVLGLIFLSNQGDDALIIAPGSTG